MDTNMLKPGALAKGLGFLDEDEEPIAPTNTQASNTEHKPDMPTTSEIRDTSTFFKENENISSESYTPPSKVQEIVPQPEEQMELNESPVEAEQEEEVDVRSQAILHSSLLESDVTIPETIERFIYTEEDKWSMSPFEPELDLYVETFNRDSELVSSCDFKDTNLNKYVSEVEGFILLHLEETRILISLDVLRPEITKDLVSYIESELNRGLKFTLRLVESYVRNGVTYKRSVLSSSEIGYLANYFRKCTFKIDAILLDEKVVDYLVTIGL